MGLSPFHRDQCRMAICISVTPCWGTIFLLADILARNGPEHCSRTEQSFMDEPGITAYGSWPATSNLLRRQDRGATCGQEAVNLRHERALSRKK